MSTIVFRGLRGLAIDLWNLLPAHRTVNQNEKRNKLPSVELLRSAQDQSKSGGKKVI